MKTTVGTNTRTPITSQKDILLVFAQKIRTFLDNQVEQLTSTDNSPPWLQNWTQLRNSGFGITKFSRHQFAKRILGNETKNTSITNLLLGLRQQFPPLDIHFEFQPSLNDTDLWHMSAKQTEPSDGNVPTISSETVAPPNTSLGPADDTSVNTDKSNTKESSIPITSESQHDGQWIDIPITGNCPNTNPVTNIPVTPAPFASSNPFMTLQNEHDEATEQEDLSEHLSYSTTSPENVSVAKQNVKDPPSTSSPIILDNAKIVDKINNLRRTGQDITAHATVDEIFTWIESTVDRFDESITDQYNQLDKNVNAAISSAKQTTKTCNGMYEKTKVYKKDFEEQITNTTELAISSVNNVANWRNTEITSKINEVHTLLAQLEATKSVPTDILNEIQTHITTLTYKINTVYEEFDDTTNNLIDDQKKCLPGLAK